MPKIKGKVRRDRILIISKWVNLNVLAQKNWEQYRSIAFSHQLWPKMGCLWIPQWHRHTVSPVLPGWVPAWRGPWLGKGGLPKERSNYSSWDVLPATHCSEVGPPRGQWEKNWVNTNWVSSYKDAPWRWCRCSSAAPSLSFLQPYYRPRCFRTRSAWRDPSSASFFFIARTQWPREQEASASPAPEPWP